MKIKLKNTWINFQAYFCIKARRASLSAPTSSSTFSPFWYTWNVGIASTPTDWLISLSWSTSTSRNWIVKCSNACSLKKGFIVLHGPPLFFILCIKLNCEILVFKENNFHTPSSCKIYNCSLVLRIAKALNILFCWINVNAFHV